MRSKLGLIVFSILLTIFLAGCSKQATSNNTANGNTENTNTTVTTTEDSNTEEMADDSTTTSTDNRAKSTGKNTNGQRSANGNAPAKRTNKEPTVQTAEKEIKKKGDRILRDSGGLIKEGERRVRGILNGRP
ncbi:MAG TPA: hypothetical protein VF658_10370 [Pyrinomonadaceae bacterium]|jgi:hypothetical protein